MIINPSVNRFCLFWTCACRRDWLLPPQFPPRPCPAVFPLGNCSMPGETARATTSLLPIVVGSWVVVAGTASFPLEATLSRTPVAELESFLPSLEEGGSPIILSLSGGLVLGCTSPSSVSVLLFVVQPELRFDNWPFIACCPPSRVRLVVTDHHVVKVCAGKVTAVFVRTGCDTHLLPILCCTAA